MTPKLARWLMSKFGSTKLTWLKMLKKSAVKLMDTFSVIAVFFPSDISKFQKGRPRSGRERPVRPSVLIWTLRKSAKTAAGLAKRLMPVPWLPGPQLGPLPDDATPPELQTLPCVEFPNELGSTVGILPTLKPKMLPPPHTWLLSVSMSGRPLNAVKMPEVNQPPRRRSPKVPPPKR